MRDGSEGFLSDVPASLCLTKVLCAYGNPVIPRCDGSRGIGFLVKNGDGDCSIILNRRGWKSRGILNFGINY